MTIISGWPNVSIGLALMGCTTSGTAVSASPNSTSQIPIYTEVSQRCRGLTTNRGKQYELDIARGNLNKFTFDNRDGLFDPTNTTSLYYPQLSTHKQIRFMAVRNATVNILEPNIANGGDTYGAGVVYQMIQQTGTTLTTVASVSPTLPLQGSVMYSSGYTNGAASGTRGWAFGNGTLTPGTQYTFSVYANIPTTSLSFKLTADCYNAAGTRLSTTTGTPVTVTSTWGRLTVSFTPPTNTVATVFYIQSNAAAVSTFSLCTDQFQLEVGASATTWTLPGATNILATNYIQSLRTYYDQLTNMQLMEMTTQDALGVLSQQLLLDVHGNEIQLLSPYAYWPLGDSSKSTMAGSVMNPVTGIQQAPGQLVSFGAGSKPSFGGTSIIPGSPQNSCLTFDNTAVAGVSWTQLNLPVTINPAAFGTFTVNLWISTTQVPSLEADILAQTQINSYSDFSIALQPNGHIKFNLTYDGTHYDSIDSGVALNDGKPHMLTAIIYFGFLKMQFWVDGTQVGDLTRTSGFGIGVNTVFTRVGNGGFNQLPYVGSVQAISFYTSQLTSGQISNLWLSGATGWSGDNTADRFNRILSYSATNIQGAVPAGSGGVQTEMGLLDCAGQSVLDALNLVVQDEQSNLYSRGDGYIGFEQRHQRWKQLAPLWTVGDGSNEVPYLKSVTSELDDLKVVNFVSASRLNGATQSATDITSVNNHFYRAYPNSLTFKTLTDSDVASIIQGIVWQFKNPAERLNQADFSPASTAGNTTWAFVVGADIGHRIKYNRRPVGAPAKALDLWIEAIQFSIVFDNQTIDWTMSIQASPGLPGNATPGLTAQQFVLTAARTTLKTSTIAGATSFTLNALPDAATNTSQSNGWTANAIQNITIYDGANTETLAVTSIATTTTGYTQFVVTTTNAATFAHTAGVTVAEFIPQAGIQAWSYNTFDTAAALDGTNILAY